MTRTAWVLLALLAPLRVAAAQDWSGDWEASPRGTRRVERAQGAWSLGAEWPGRGLVTVSGPSIGRSLLLRGRLPATPGLAGALEGENAPAAVDLAIEGTWHEGPDGVSADVVWREGGAVVRSERWTRPGPAELEILSVDPAAGWEPKVDGPLKVRFRVRGSAVAVRLRVALEPEGDDRRVAFYAQELGYSRNDGLPSRIVIFEADVADGARLEPGEHETSWCGRDRTAAQRLALGGGHRVVLLGGGARAQARLTVAPPRSEYVGPRWPMRRLEGLDVRTNQPAIDPGRRREAILALMSPTVEAVGFAAPPPTHIAGVGTDQALRALAQAAQVTFGTHGLPGKIQLYTDPAALEHRDTDVAELGRVDVECMAGVKPLRDLHTVVIWACLTGALTSAERKRAMKHGRDPEEVVPRLPASLLAGGADVVISFTEQLVSAGHDPFVLDFFKRALNKAEKEHHRPGEVLAVMHVAKQAATEADRVVWGEINAYKRAVFAPMVPAQDCIRVDLAAGIDPASESLAPARWGNSTN